VTTDTSTPHKATLADLETESGWICWQDSDQCYARRPQTPPDEHDARGEDPADLREAIMLALRLDQDIPQVSTPPVHPAPQPAQTHHSHPRTREHATMPAKSTADTAAQQADLTSLIGELTTRGLQATPRTSLDGTPCLTVRNPRASILAEIVYARDGSYWWSWHEPIAPCDQPTTAAGILTRVLRAIGE
jgi:hypothetical protein